MRKVIIALALSLCAFGVRADCTGPAFAVNAVDQSLSVAFDPGSAPAVKAGDQVSVAIGDTVLETEVVSINTSLPGETIIKLRKPEEAEIEGGTFVVHTGLTTDQAQFTYKDTTGEQKSVDLCLTGHFSTRERSFAVGPTMAQDDQEMDGADNDDTEDVRPSAVRLQYTTSFRRFREVGNSGQRRIPSRRLMQQEFAISIDTTDKEGDDFIDDNRVMAGMFAPRMTFGNAVNRVRLGIVGKHAHAFHGDDNNSDVTLSVDGWLPLFQAANIGSTKRRLALPLQFRVSLGKRWQDVDGVTSDGDVAEWSLLYHAYLFDNYRLDLEHRTVFNDVENRPASTPRTQHSWKATVLFIGAEDSRFNVIASYEDGHSGPVFSQLRQFFLGVGLKSGLGSLIPN